MSVLQAVLIVALAVVGTSYAWGMRGDLIGGEKGAMLPGAFLGAALALLSGDPAIADRFYVLAAVGAASMYFGGTETYAQTMDFAYFKKENGGKPENFKKSMLGLSIKGFGWFGLCGAFLGIALAAMAGQYYKLTDLVIFVALIPLYRLVGIMIFNRPYKPEQGKMPRLYFSKGRREEYGALIMMFAAAVILMAIKGDSLGLKLAFAGGFSGAVGWIGAHSMNVCSLRFRVKKNKYFFGSWQEQGKIDNWKLMEFSLGAAGALGISLCYVLNGATLSRYSMFIASSGSAFKAFTAIGSTKYLMIAAFIWILLLVADAMHFIIPEPPKQKSELIKLRSRNIIRQDEFEEMMLDASDDAPSKHYLRYAKLVEICERPLYSYIPLLLALLGCAEAAAVEAILCIYWVAIEKTFGDRYHRLKKEPAAGWAIGILGVEILSILIFTLPREIFGLPSLLIPAFVIWFGIYILLSVHMLRVNRRLKEPGYAAMSVKEKILSSKGAQSVIGHYVFCAILWAVLLIMGLAVTR